MDDFILLLKDQKEEGKEERKKWGPTLRTFGQ